MGLFGSKHGSSTSTTNSTIWDAALIESLVTSGNAGNINYTPYQIADPTQEMKNVINYETSGAAFNNSKSMANKASSMGAIFSSDISKLKGITGEDIMNLYKSGTSDLFNAASGFMANEDQSIEDSLLAKYGSQSAQLAESTQGTFTSGAANAHSALAVGTANSMESEESELAAKVMMNAANITGNAIKGGIRGYSNMIGREGQATAGLYKAAAKMTGNAVDNYWNAGLAKWAYQNAENHQNWKNEMIIDNKSGFSNLMMLEALLQSGGADTSSTNTVTY